MSSIRTSKASLTAAIAQVSLALISLLSVLGSGMKASAQVTSANDGTNTLVEVVGDYSVDGQGQRIDISGGQISSDRSNLFQSFEQFNVTSEQTANFITTPEIKNIVGRISGGSASIIDGALQISGSDANLYLMNPAGILMGPNAQLNLSGGFTATTATDIGFEDGQFKATESGGYSSLSGNPITFHFDTAQAGAVINAGNLAVSQGKSISLIGGTVVNVGSLSAPSGAVTIAAVKGENLVRISQGNQLLSLEIAASDPSAMTLSAIAPQSIGEMLTGSGLLNATALIVDTDGTVRLGSSTVDGSIGDMKRPKAGLAIATGSISTTNFAPNTTGGNINILGNQVSLQNATLEASGSAGGGLIRIGGDYQGKGSVANAFQTIVDSDSNLFANALDRGNGGNIVVWANDTTAFHGNVESRGGSFSGNGGFSEISGKQQLIMDGSVDLSASRGSVGSLLLDPENIVITDGAAPISTQAITYLSSSYVENLSNTANVELAATNDFTIDALSDNKLLFKEGRSITFIADSDLDGSGAFRMLDTRNWIDAERGNINIFGAGVTAGELTTDTFSSHQENAGNIIVISSQGINTSKISTNNYSFNNNAGNGGNVRLEAQNGDIAINNLIKTWSHANRNNAGLGGNVSLSASGSISVKDIVTYSRAGNNNANNGGAVSLIANGDIYTQSIQTQSISDNNNSRNGGDVTVSSANGSIETGSIFTSNGSVSLDALDDIKIAFIDASSIENHERATLVDISTQGLFTAIGKGGATGASISTLGTTNGSITISYDSPDNPFVIGDISVSGTASSIQSPTAMLANRSFSLSHLEGNISLINRADVSEIDPPEPPPTEPGINLGTGSPQPPAEPPTEPPTGPATERPEIAEPREERSPLSQLKNATQTSALLASIADIQQSSSRRQISERIQSLTAPEFEDLLQTFENVEAGISEEFQVYLGLPTDQQPRDLATVGTVQKTLADIRYVTGAKPALVYVYFVPDTESLNANPDERPNKGPDEDPDERPNDELEIMVITANGTPIRRRGQGITRAKVEETSRILRQQVTSQFSSAQQYLPPAQQLYDWIIEPIEQTLKQENISSLGFVMDTGLRTLPVAALYDGDRYLVENYSLGLLPSFSLTNFGQADQLDRPGKFETAKVLAMGASRFEHQPDLPAVEAEVDIAAAHARKGDVFLNEDFVLKNVQAQIKNKAFSILHLATHAVFESGDLNNSYVQLWDDELSLNKLSNLKLDESNISLIVLSACNTALGDPASEYGFAGFAINAGSQSALASLWPVNDEGTLGFMSQFYDQLRGASIRAEALRQAQIRMIHGEVGIDNGAVYGSDNKVIATLPKLAASGQWNFAHPFYWSAFTMIGNPW
ncbi:MAG: CHAT domain-containing protein [Phormidesmis sp.]